jgi:hypothetical protein
MMYLGLALFFATAVSGHGFLLSIELGGANVSAWVHDVDSYRKPAPDRIERRVQGNTPVKDINSNAMSCNIDGGSPPGPAPLVADVDAGSDITYQWTDWVRRALRRINGSLVPVRLRAQDIAPRTHHQLRRQLQRRLPLLRPSRQEGVVQGKRWFSRRSPSNQPQIQERGFIRMDKNADGSAWPRFATGDFVDQNSQWTVNIPKDLKAGQYLIRHEIIALHLANELGGAEL